MPAVSITGKNHNRFFLMPKSVIILRQSEEKPIVKLDTSLLKSATAYAIVITVYCVMLFILEKNGVKAIPCL